MTNILPTENTNILIKRMKTEVRGEHIINPQPTLHETPRILFHGFSGGERAVKMFQDRILNTEGNLSWFTDSPTRAAYAYGFRPFNPYTLKYDETFYILAIFPHECTDLARWVVDIDAPTGFSKSSEYITDQEISLNDGFILELNQIKRIFKEIKRNNLTTKELLSQKLGINPHQQLDLRKQILKELLRINIS